jgi:predicted nucleic acid-binding protein
MTALVVDASVGVKWFVKEDFTPDAQRLQTGGYGLHVPGFFDVEVAGVLWKKHRRGDITREEADRFVSALVRLPITRHQDRDLVDDAFDIAVQTGRTIYDSVYVALAARLGVRVVTADEKLRNALTATPWAAHLLWVGDVP